MCRASQERLGRLEEFVDDLLHVTTFRKFQACDLPGLEKVVLIYTEGPSILRVSVSKFLPFSVIVDGGNGFCKQCNLAAWSF